jgi:aarF domain-containing kinase
MENIVDDDDDDKDTIVVMPSTPKQQQQEQLQDANTTMSTTSSTLILSKVKRVIRMIRRIVKLIILFTPVVILYPLPWMIDITYQLLAPSILSLTDDDNSDAQELVWKALEQKDSMVSMGPWKWYYRIVLLHAVERSGAAMIKIMQWAGSRPDMFGMEFCQVFSQLQDNTTPHEWKYTEQAMMEAYGPHWRDRIEIDDILGSGCIAQVYKGYIILPTDDDTDATTNRQKQQPRRRIRPVAIKVMHPHVEADIDADLDILRVTVRIMEYLDFGPLKDLKWLNLPGFIEEMADMLKLQLDLRREGRNLVQFHQNFMSNDVVIFPQLIEACPPTKNILVETFCEGVPIMDFIKHNKADRDMLTKMCTGAIQAVCQMIFLGTCLCVGILPRV